MNDDEWNVTFVNLQGGDFRWCDITEIEKREDEWWGEEGSLQVDGDHYTKPDRVENYCQ